MEGEEKELKRKKVYNTFLETNYHKRYVHTKTHKRWMKRLRLGHAARSECPTGNNTTGIICNNYPVLLY